MSYTRLKYMSAVPKTPPVEQVAVSSSHMEEVDKAIREKVRQNEAERTASIEVAEKFIVYNPNP